MLVANTGAPTHTHTPTRDFQSCLFGSRQPTEETLVFFHTIIPFHFFSGLCARHTSVGECCHLRPVLEVTLEADALGGSKEDTGLERRLMLLLHAHTSHCSRLSLHLPLACHQVTWRCRLYLGGNPHFGAPAAASPPHTQALVSVFRSGDVTVGLRRGLGGGDVGILEAMMFQPHTTAHQTSLEVTALISKTH